MQQVLVSIDQHKRSLRSTDVGWWVVLGFNAISIAKVITIMAVGDAHVFPGFLTPVLTLLSFPRHRLIFSNASADMGG